MTIANFITYIRLFLAPVVIFFLHRGDTNIAFYSFLTASLTDWLDGFVARNFSKQSEYGRYLDPIADKILILMVTSALTFLDKFPILLFWIIVSRDVLIMTGSFFIIYYKKSLEIKPKAIGKVCTFSQIVLCLLILANLATQQYASIFAECIMIAILVTSATTIWSGVSYVRTVYKHLKKQ